MQVFASFGYFHSIISSGIPSASRGPSPFVVPLATKPSESAPLHMSTLSTQKRVKRKAAEGVDYKGMEEKDLDDYGDDEFQMDKDSQTDDDEDDDDDDDEDEEVENGQKSSMYEKGRGVRDAQMWLSDSESIDGLEGDDHEMYMEEEEDRHARQRDRRDRMWRAMTEAGEVETSGKFKLDEADEAWMRKFIAFVTSTTKKMNAGSDMISEETTALLEEGLILTGVAGGSQAQTPNLYKNGLVRVLGYLQDQMIKTGSGSLEDGKIRLRNFFSYRTRNWIKIINIIPVIEEYEKFLSMKPHCLAGYLMLTMLVDEDLDTLQGLAKFADQTIEDKYDRDEDAENRRDRYVEKLRKNETTMRGKRKNSKFAKWEQQKRGQAKKAKTFEEDYLDLSLPPTIELIRKFYRSPVLKDLVGRMTKYADQLAQVGAPAKASSSQTNNPTGPFQGHPNQGVEEEPHIPESFLGEMNGIVPVVIFSRAGNRPELLADQTRGDFACATPDMATPNKPLHLDSRVDQANITDRMREGTYHNPNPHLIDTNDPEPDQQNEAWEWLKGYTMPAKLHKTFDKFPLWIFLSQGDHFLLEMYLHISHKILQQKGITLTHAHALLVSRTGTPLITKKRVFNLGPFREIVGLVSCRPYDFRHLFTNTLHDTNEASVLQMEMYAAGHSEQTARDNYVSVTLKKFMSRMAHTLYRRIIGLPEDRVSAPDRLTPFMGKKQTEMMKDMREGVSKDKKNDFLLYQSKKNEYQQPVIGRELTINEKIALVSLVIECEETHRHRVEHKFQDVLDAF